MTTTTDPTLRADIVILGGGLAAAQLAHSLRDEGFTGSVLLVTEETQHPYHRPPLSKGYLDGSLPAARLWLRDPASYDTKEVQVLLGARAERLDRTARTLHLVDGRTIGYDRLVLATGARNRLLPGLPADAGVLYIRTREDADLLRVQTQSAKSVAIVGGGFLGLEIAHVLRKAGKEVTVLEMAPRLLARTSSPVVSEAVRALHTAAGVRIETGCTITQIERAQGGMLVRLGSGEQLEVDLVVACIGVVPNMEIAAAAGLATGNGIVVDEALATSDPRIHAIGDCAQFPSRYSEAAMRLESVQNATDQARCLAATLASGTPRPYTALPWFWSDQGAKVQIAGIVSAADEFPVKGDVAALSFSVEGFKNGQLVCVESVNRPADHVAARKLLAPAPTAAVR